jgi:hypothetical protein
VQFQSRFSFFSLFTVALRFPIKPPMIAVRYEADKHWLRYGRLAPRPLRQ